VTHVGDNENPRLKSSTTVGAGNSNQEFVTLFDLLEASFVFEIEE
jgi:hypothetical protein